MHEIACQFGPEERLFGIVSQPERPRIGAPAVLFLTAGLLHHVGPHRLYVQAARQLNTLGFTALRFDLGDVGDSQDVKLKFIYTGGASEFINSHKQLPVMFPQASQSANMDMSYLPDSDHLCTLAKDRNKLCRLIAQWADSNFESLVSGDNAAPVQDADDLLKSA